LTKIEKYVSAKIGCEDDPYGKSYIIYNLIKKIVIAPNKWRIKL